MQLSGISIFPIKSCRGVLCPDSDVEPWGLGHDRRYLVIDPDGTFVSQRECPAMARVDALPERDGLCLRGADLPDLRVAAPGLDAEDVMATIWRDRVIARRTTPAADQWVSTALGRPCRLVYMASPDRARRVDAAFAQAGDHVSFADGFPVLLTSTASLDDLNARLPAPIGMDRFRANLVVEGAQPWAEDQWRQVRIGPVVLAIVKPCTRCIVTTTDQRTGDRDAGLELLRTLQGFRRDARGQVLFGQNLVPRTLGRVALGDPVEVLA